MRLIDVLWIPAQRFVFNLFYRFHFRVFQTQLVPFPNNSETFAKWFGAPEQKTRRAGLENAFPLLGAGSELLGQLWLHHVLGRVRQSRLGSAPPQTQKKKREVV
jgi:hypothetical protein